VKFMATQVAYFFRDRTTQRNVRSLLKFLAVLAALMVTYSVLFHYIAELEGQRHSWLSGVYWTVVTMTTLGYGDITFQSDLGRVFSAVVLLSGVLFLLILLPFAFIQFFYAPWLEARAQMRAPRELPPETHGHVLLVGYDTVATSLIPRLIAYDYPYAVIEPELSRALELHDEGIRVMLGPPDDLLTYRHARAERAALVVAGHDDFLNTNVTFTVREVSERVPVVAKARLAESVDILELAGATHVVLLADLLGRSLARRALGGDVRTSRIGSFGDIHFAEAPARATPLVGRILRESRLRETTGVTVVGIWDRGVFEPADPGQRIEDSSVLLLAGTQEQLERFDALTAIYNPSYAPVLILGGGKVGRAAASALEAREVDYRIVEKDASRIRDPERYVLGSAAELEVLEGAGIREAPSVLVTTHDDATNIYLTIYCRKLRPDVQVISRSTLERNVSTLHRAGADHVLSYASLGASSIFNLLQQGTVLMMAEGLDLFREPIPPSLAGRTLAESAIRPATGCLVVAIDGPGGRVVNPTADAVLADGGELVLLGSREGERTFRKRFQ
jgi:voltage-gated potassium channel